MDECGALFLIWWRGAFLARSDIELSFVSGSGVHCAGAHLGPEFRIESQRFLYRLQLHLAYGNVQCAFHRVAVRLYRKAKRSQRLLYAFVDGRSKIFLHRYGNHFPVRVADLAQLFVAALIRDAQTYWIASTNGLLLHLYFRINMKV